MSLAFFTLLSILILFPFSLYLSYHILYSPHLNFVCNLAIMSKFSCQRCNSPLIMDPSITKMSHAQQDLILGGVTKLNEADIAPIHTDFIPPERLALLKEIDFDSKDNKPMYFKDFRQNELAEEIDTENNITENQAGLLDSHSYVYLTSDDPKEAQSDHSDNQLEINGHNNVKSGPNDPKTISQRVHTLNNIFQHLSTNEVAHPLCCECSELYVANFKLKFDQNQKEKELYLGFLRKLKSQEDVVDHSELDSSLKSTLEEHKLLEREGQQKLSELKKLEQERVELDKELRDLEKYYDDLVDGKFHLVLLLRNKTEFDLATAQNNLNKYKASYQKNLDELDRLRSFNVLSEIFRISADGDHGTINGYRLGYRVPWPENNAALGQVVLLLLFLLKRLNFHSKEYKLVPVGSKSYIIKHNSRIGQRNETTTTESDNVTGNGSIFGSFDKSDRSNSGKLILHLYTSNEFSLGKLFNFNKLDISMIALLEIVLQLESHLVAIDPEIEFPFPISLSKHTIGGKNIRVTSNAEWTISSKYLLTNLNWILQYSSVLLG